MSCISPGGWSRVHIHQVALAGDSHAFRLSEDTPAPDFTVGRVTYGLQVAGCHTRSGLAGSSEDLLWMRTRMNQIDGYGQVAPPFVVLSFGCCLTRSRLDERHRSGVPAWYANVSVPNTSYIHRTTAAAAIQSYTYMI